MTYLIKDIYYMVTVCFGTQFVDIMNRYLVGSFSIKAKIIISLKNSVTYMKTEFTIEIMDI